MSHLILGGTGTVGSQVVARLLERGESVRVLTRTEEKARKLPKGAVGIVGDLQDPSCYSRVFRDVRDVFLLNAVSSTELQEGLAAVNECLRNGVKRVVYLSVHDAEKGPAIPHFAAKLAIENALKQSGLSYTILRANNFFQNDYWIRNVIVASGAYAQPIGDIGLARIDVRDIADAAVNALTQPDHERRTYALVGPEILSGNACADFYSTALGRSIRYAGNDLEAWSKEAIRMIPAWMVYDYKLMYAMFQEQGLAANNAQVRETETILGRRPRRFREFAFELAKG